MYGQQALITCLVAGPYCLQDSRFQVPTIVNWEEDDDDDAAAAVITALLGNERHEICMEQTMEEQQEIQNWGNKRFMLSFTFFVNPSKTQN